MPNEATPATPAAAAPGTQPVATSPAASGAPGGKAEAASGAAAPPIAAPVDKLARAKETVARARASASRAMELRAGREAAERQARQATEENARLRSQNQATEARIAELGKNPIAALRALGYTPEEAAAAIKGAGTPESLVAEVRAELAAEKAARQQLEQQLMGEKQAAAYQEAAKAFLVQASDAKVYPHLAKQPPSIVLAAGKQVLAEAKARTGHTYSDAEVLAYLEENWSAHEQAARTPPEASPQSATPSPETNSSTPPRTMTNALEALAYTLPDNFADLSDVEQKRHLAKKLAATTRKPVAK